MKKRILFGWLCLVFLLLVGCSSEQKIEVEKDLIQVVDGDTIKVKLNDKQETIRLRLVDSPELNDSKTGKQPLSEEAKAYIEKRIREAKQITLEEDKEAGRDKYNRLLCYVFVDGELLQEELVKRGYARIAFVDQSESKYLKSLMESESEARNKKIGIWQWEGYASKDGFRPEVIKTNQPKYVASKNSQVYHPIDCNVVQTIKPENRIFYYSEEEAMKDQRQRSQVKECWENH